MIVRAGIRRATRKIAPLVALLCFVLAQATWGVPLHALTHCRHAVQAAAAQPEMHHEHAMHRQAQNAVSEHDCCPPSEITAACEHPAMLDMAQCVTSQTCCRIEQGRRVPKYTSNVISDRVDLGNEMGRPFASGAITGQMGGVAAISLPPSRAVLDQKADLRI